MRAIARADREGRIRFASAQSVIGQNMFRHFDLDPDAFETVLLIHGGRAYGKLDAVDEVAKIVGGWWRLVFLLRPWPQRVRDHAYDLVANNRYRLFGRTETCMLPDPAWKDRVIDPAQP
jgi:predicted DCC family thiol-disulfide oxidoreductase YuxK